MGGPGPRQDENQAEEMTEAGLSSELSTLGWVGGLLAFILTVLVMVAVLRFRVRREFKASGDLDPGPLVESLVRDREAWPGFAGAWRRPLVPTHGVDRQSLAGVENAASQSALFVAKSPGEWMAPVIKGGGLVLDGSTRAGRVAATAFGAFDLDQWASMWRCSRTNWFGLQVQEALCGTGLNLNLRHSDDVRGGDGSGFAVDQGARAWVVIDETDPDWRRCRDLAGARPAEAVFRAADIVVEMLPLSGRRTQLALSELARKALIAVDLTRGTPL